MSSAQRTHSQTCFVFFRLLLLTEIFRLLLLTENTECWAADAMANNHLFSSVC